MFLKANSSWSYIKVLKKYFKKELAEGDNANNWGKFRILRTLKTRIVVTSYYVKRDYYSDFFNPHELTKIVLQKRIFKVSNLSIWPSKLNQKGFSA